MRRKFLSIVLCVCMMMTMAPFAFAAEGETSSESGSDSSATIDLATFIQRVAEANYNYDGKGITVKWSPVSGCYDTRAGHTCTVNNKVATGNTPTYINSNLAQYYEFSGQTDVTITNVHFVYEAKDFTICANNNGISKAWSKDTIKTAQFYMRNAGNTTIEGCTFDNVVFTSFENTGTTTVTNCTFKNAYNTYGIKDLGGSSVTVSGCTFENCSGGVMLNSNAARSASTTVTITGNAFDKISTRGLIQIPKTGDYSNAEFALTGNTATNCGPVLRQLNSTVSLDNVASLSYLVGSGAATLYTTDSIQPVAKAGDVSYTSVSAAVNAITENGTVTLLKDTAENVTIPAGKTITIDLDGKTWTIPTDVGINVQGYLTITGNGTVTCQNTPIVADASTGAGTVVIENGTVESKSDYGIYAKNGGSVIVNGGTVSSNDAALAGNNTTGTMNFTVAGGTLTAAQGPAIYMPGQVALNISGGTLNGGISLRMGQVNISGGTINAITSGIDSPSQYYNYSGNAWLPDALYVFGGTYPNGDETHGNSLNLNITGGTFNCTNGQGSAVAIYDIGKVEQDANITISDTAKLATNASSRSAYQVLNLSDIGVTTPATGYGAHSGDVNSSITGGLFSSDPSVYCGTTTEGKKLTGIENPDSATKAQYPFTVGVASEKAAAVATAKPEITSDVQTTNEQEETLAKNTEAALNGTSAPSATGSALDAAAKTVAQQNTESSDTYVESLKNLTNTSNLDADDVYIVVQSYLDIKVTDVDATDATKSITLDITPMYQKVATTVDVTTNPSGEIITDSTKLNANAVKIGDPQKLNVSGPVTLSIPLPSGFASNGKAYVQHKGYEYTATVDSNNIATFTNPHGFSSFTITAEQTAVAEVNGTSYINFQDAVDAVENGGTIKALKDITSTVSGNKSFTVESGNYNVNLTAASGYNLTNDGNGKYTVSRQHSGSSGSASTTYNVTVNAATNGTVAADKKTASKGTTVTITASPSAGYVVDAVKVVDKDGKDVAVTEKNGKYVFTMPGSAVTVTATFKAETPAPSGLPFTDVKSGDWFYDAVKYAYEQGLMTGTSATTFSPNGTMNRAMIVTVLYRLEKTPAVTAPAKFADVPAGQWYSDAVAWAAANNIVNGYNETTFGPMNAVTREQMAAILYRYEQYKGMDTVTLEENLSRFPDKDKVSAYAVPAMQWAVGQKVINGNADGTLNPTGTATRAQVAQIFTNLLNK